jgi:hypothetical protein
MGAGLSEFQGMLRFGLQFLPHKFTSNPTYFFLQTYSCSDNIFWLHNVFKDYLRNGLYLIAKIHAQSGIYFELYWISKK